MRSSALALAFALALAAVSASPTAEAAPAATISKTEARALPTEALKARMAAQLAGVLIEAPRPKGSRHPVRALTDLWFATRPRPTDAEGVCQSDTVVFALEPDRPTADRDTDADTPMRTIGVSTQANFHVSPENAPVHCDRLDPFKAHFIHADSSEEARLGADLTAIITMEAATTPRFAIDCKAGAGAGCGVLLETLSLDQVGEIDPCGGPLFEPNCLNLQTNDFALQIRYVEGPLRITRIAVDQVITVADQRRD